MLEFLILGIIMMGINDLIVEPDKRFAVSKILMYLLIISIFVGKLGANVALILFFVALTAAYLALLFFSNKNKFLFVIDTIVFVVVTLLVAFKMGTAI